MNYIKLSLSVALLSLTIAMADEDIAIVEPIEVLEVMQEESFSGFYLGAGYTYMDAAVDGRETGNAYTLLAGYNINEYLALELRYIDTVGDMDVTGDKSILNRPNGSYERRVTNTALYIKPQYNVIDALNVYGLLGYGKTNLRSTDTSSFQWGVGAAYALLYNLDVYVDYTRLTSDNLDNVGKIINNTRESQVSTTTVGLGYMF